MQREETLKAKPVTLLLVDDAPDIIQMLQDILSVTPFKSMVAYDGTSALRILELYPIDLAILDMQLPDMLGTELLQRIHQHQPQLPCLFVSGMGDEKDVVKGLALGAEDYITKPFRPQELIARIKKILTRYSVIAPLSHLGGTPQPSGIYNRHQLWLNPQERSLHLHNQPVILTRIEFDLLHLLIRHENQVLTRTQILNHLWPDSLETGNRAVDTHIKHLRKKLADDPQQPRFIHTIRGVGYSFRPEKA
jgi:DNA-binding response OmpR family regulator